MSERIKYQKAHILLLVISFSISALLLSYISSFNSNFTREKTSQKKVSPELNGLSEVTSKPIEDEDGNILGDAFIYTKDDELHVVFSATDEKRIESTYIRLTDNLIPSTKFESIARSYDYSIPGRSSQLLQTVVIPLSVIGKNTHLISAVRTANTMNGGRYDDGTIIFQPQIIQSIIH